MSESAYQCLMKSSYIDREPHYAAQSAAPVRFGTTLSDRGRLYARLQTLVQVARRERKWDAFMQIGTHSSTGSMGGWVVLEI